VIIGGNVKPGDEAVKLLDRDPTVLADVNAEGLGADRVGYGIGEVAVTALEIDASGHGSQTQQHALESPARQLVLRS
jgi:hypothetical protein